MNIKHFLCKKKSSEAFYDRGSPNFFGGPSRKELHTSPENWLRQKLIHIAINNPMPRVYKNVLFRDKIGILTIVGPVIQKTFQQKSATCIVERVFTPSITSTRYALLNNPFRTAVPFWGQTTWTLTGLSPKRDCGSKSVKRGETWTHVIDRHADHLLSRQGRRLEQNIHTKTSAGNPVIHTHIYVVRFDHCCCCFHINSLTEESVVTQRC